jgi:CCR4-NOT transcription complex subunit 7/8
MSETKTDTPTSENDSSTIFFSKDGKQFEIREVWASNLDAEMKNIREVLEKYPYVSMVSILYFANLQSVCLYKKIWLLVQDTEFPGIVAKPLCEFGASDFTYQVRNNLKLHELFFSNIFLPFSPSDSSLQL